MASIHKMLNSRSIEVVGATLRIQYDGRLLVAAMKTSELVHIYPVNPIYDDVQRLKPYPSCPRYLKPDLVCIVFSCNRVLGVLENVGIKKRKGTRQLMPSLCGNKISRT